MFSKRVHALSFLIIMSAQAPLSSVMDIVAEVKGTGGPTTYQIFDQNVPATQLQTYLNESAAAITEDLGSAYTYQSGDPNITQILVKRAEVYYSLTRLFAQLAGFVITDGHTLSINGVSQARFEAKFQTYQAQFTKYQGLWNAIRYMINPMFLNVPQTNPEGVTVWGTPVSYWSYPNTIY